MRRPWSLVLTLMLSVACGDPDPAGPPDAFCAPLSVLQAKCWRCHQDPPESGAPFPLLRYADTRAFYPPAQTEARVSDAMLSAIRVGLMPPLALSVDPPVEPLTEAEKTILLDWLGQGAPGPECPEQP